jgi:hypothetical protein
MTFRRPERATRVRRAFLPRDGGAATSMVCEALLAAPELSVTVMPTVYAPGARKLVRSCDVEPSQRATRWPPTVQLKLLTASVGGRELEASKSHSANPGVCTTPLSSVTLEKCA